MRRTFLGGVLAIRAVAAMLGSASAAEEAPLLRLGHYSTGNGLVGFVRDRLGTPVKLRFDDSREILALTATPADAGATRLRRDDGATLLALGDGASVVLFGEAARDGSPAFLDQRAQPLAVSPATKAAAADSAARTSDRLKERSGLELPMAFDARLDADSPQWSAMADAAVVTGLALEDVARSKLGHDALAAKVARVVIRAAARSGIALEDKTLVISVVAGQPVTGRPSSALIKLRLGDLP